MIRYKSVEHLYFRFTYLGPATRPIRFMMAYDVSSSVTQRLNLEKDECYELMLLAHDIMNKL